MAVTESAVSNDALSCILALLKIATRLASRHYDISGLHSPDVLNWSKDVAIAWRRLLRRERLRQKIGNSLSCKVYKEDEEVRWRYGASHRRRKIDMELSEMCPITAEIMTVVQPVCCFTGVHRIQAANGGEAGSEEICEETKEKVSYRKKDRETKS